MSGTVPKLLLVVALGVAGLGVLYRASQGGGPIYYFFSAVLLGMAFAAWQGMRGPPRA